MIVFWRLILAMMLTDFVLQPNKFYQWKADSHKGRAAHVLVFVLLALALTWQYLGLTWFSLAGISIKGYAAITVITLLHYIIDKMFEKNVLHAVRLTRFQKLVLHHLLMLLTVFVFSPDVDLTEGWNLFPERWVSFLVGLIAVTRMMTLAIFAYEIDKNLLDLTAPNETYITTLQRAVLYMLCLIPGSLWLLFVPAWFLMSIYASKKRILDLSPFNLYVGSAFAVLIGVIARAAIYIWN
ncbi:hypothetical protein AAIR98_001883 [Elusimicrobium simillimum]|uniref:DUF3307 domain-containing protein n=1 Tax=Elusimicrobium simillimum TaxID=3143438 RepID=UPI003C6FE538